jgi:hypothetical protein
VLGRAAALSAPRLSEGDEPPAALVVAFDDVRELGLRENLLALRRRDSGPSLSRQRAHVQPDIRDPADAFVVRTENPTR